METTGTPNERTPLIENGAKSRTTPTEQAPLNNKEATSNEKLPSSEQGAASESTQVNISFSGNFDQETEEVSLEEVVQAIVTEWRRVRKPKQGEVMLDFFSNSELYAMHIAWKRVTKDRHCCSADQIIAQDIAAAIATEILPKPDDCDEEELVDSWWYLAFHSDRNLLAAILLREWEKITLGAGFSRMYHQIFEDTDEQLPDVSQFLLRQVEMYDKVHGFIFNSRLQICLHCLILIWPVLILITGYKSLDCPMSHHLSHLLTMLGSAGCLAIVTRLVLIHMTSTAKDPYKWSWGWVGLRIIEFSFLILFVVQAFHLFVGDPTAEPEPESCVENFYTVALRINYVSMALISVYLVYYYIKFFLVQLDNWRLVFKLFAKLFDF